MANNESNLPESIQVILSKPSGHSFKNLRDRAAYMFITGCFPTHLRSDTNELLRLIGEFAPSASSLDGRSGSLRVSEDAAIRLDLDNHPMVKKVRRFLAKGYHITVSPTAVTRRSYGRIYLFRRQDVEDSRVTVKCDGSVLDHW